MYVPIMKHSRPLAARALRQKSHFSQIPTAATQIVEQVTSQNAEHYPIRGKLTTFILGTPPQDHNFTDVPIFEHINLYLILSDFLLSK